MKKLLNLALLIVMGCFIATSCSDDADRRRAYVENNTQDTLVLYLQSGQKYSELHHDFTTVFPPSEIVEMPFFSCPSTAYPPTNLTKTAKRWCSKPKTAPKW
ncbi:MAG: hypothetical protein L6U16_09895 [Porphyromonadaceae bacterium]|nr:MAG: hypothetical protein L6U16_09895 [Porphyromonadaceae bacterium]